MYHALLGAHVDRVLICGYNVDVMSYPFGLQALAPVLRFQRAFWVPLRGGPGVPSRARGPRGVLRLCVSREP